MSSLPSALRATILLSLSSLVHHANADSVSITPPVQSPANASDIIDQSFLGFGIESTSLPDYTGNASSPNTFSQNLMSIFSKKTGAPTYIRVGGTSMDNAIYDPTQTSTAVIFTDNTTDLHQNLTLGPPWLSSFPLLPTAKWILQLPLARKNTSNALLLARDALSAMGGPANLDAIEVGNEPNLYPNSGNNGTRDRPADYTPQAYAAEVTDFYREVEESVGLGSGALFQALTYASGVQNPWNARNVFGAPGWDASLIKSVSYHYYQAYGNASLQATLMNHTRTVALTNAFKAPIQFLNTTYPNITFVLGEIGSALRGHGPDGYEPNDYDLNGSLGAALWTVDFLLHVMSIGVRRVSMQLGTQFPFTAWQPVTSHDRSNDGRPAQVNGGFYGHVFIADFIGSEGDLRVAPLTLNASNPNMVGYAGYHGGALAKIVLVDLKLWRSENGTERPSSDVTLSGLEGASSVKVERLASPQGGGAQAEDITWAGQQWSVASDGLPEMVKNDTEVLSISNGEVAVGLSASEAVMITLQN